jgi:hypothetical protein
MAAKPSRFGMVASGKLLLSITASSPMTASRFRVPSSFESVHFIHDENPPPPLWNFLDQRHNGFTELARTLPPHRLAGGTMPFIRRYSTIWPQ